MVSKSDIGKLGEDIAFNYLKEVGYKIINRNFKEKYGEIDIIAQKDSKLVFFEVKTLVKKDDLEETSQLTPEDNLNKQKLKKLQKICQMFANKHPELFEDRYGWRIDLLAISLSKYNTLTNKYESCVVNCYENI